MKTSLNFSLGIAQVADLTDLYFLLSLQNALAATAAPFQGQYGGFEAYPYATAATGEISFEKASLSNHKS